MYATLRLTVSQCVNDSSSIMSDLNMLCVQLFSKVGQETDSSMKATRSQLPSSMLSSWQALGPLPGSLGRAAPSSPPLTGQHCFKS